MSVNESSDLKRHASVGCSPRPSPSARRAAVRLQPVLSHRRGQGELCPLDGSRICDSGLCEGHRSRERSRSRGIASRQVKRHRTLETANLHYSSRNNDKSDSEFSAAVATAILISVPQWRNPSAFARLRDLLLNHRLQAQSASPASPTTRDGLPVAKPEAVGMSTERFAIHSRIQEHESRDAADRPGAGRFCTCVARDHDPGPLDSHGGPAHRRRTRPAVAAALAVSTDGHARLLHPTACRRPA